MADGTPEGTDEAQLATAKLLGLLEPEEVTPEPEDVDEPVEDETLDGLEDEESSEGEADDDAEAEEQEERTYTVKVDGTEVEVTESELLNGYSRTADYTRKTMELAEKSKAFQAEVAAVQQERQLYAQHLGQLARATQPQRPDFEAIAKENGTEAALRARFQYENQMEQYQAIEGERQATLQKIEQQNRQARAQWEADERQALLNAKPEWKDPEVYAQEASKIADYAIGLGVPPQALNNVSAIETLILEKAMKWDEAQSKAAQVKPNQGKVLRPGAKGQVGGKSKAKKTRERFQRTGSDEDAADALRVILGTG